MFKDVSLMNEMFGNLKGDPNIINWPRVENQSKNILDEYEELLEALRQEDPAQLRDALCDIMVFTLGVYHLIGGDADKDMQEVYRSNMSKFCTNKDELEKTINYYNRIGIKVYGGGEFPYAYVKSLSTQIGANGRSYPKDKFLKCINWKEPNFERRVL